MNTFYSHLNIIPYNLIKSGKKIIESRINDEKRQLMQVGDTLFFILMGNDNEIIKTKIVNLHKFASFKELFAHFDKTLLGYAENEVADSKDMEQYYSKEEQEKYGVVGIEIEIIK